MTNRIEGIERPQKKPDDIYYYLGVMERYKEVLSCGRELYDRIRPLFDVANDLGLKVEYPSYFTTETKIGRWGLEEPMIKVRPGDRERYIFAVGELQESDHIWLADRQRLASEVFRNSEIDVHLMMFPANHPSQPEGIYIRPIA